MEDKETINIHPMKLQVIKKFPTIRTTLVYSDLGNPQLSKNFPVTKASMLEEAQA
jgi:hypothetical protein